MAPNGDQSPIIHQGDEYEQQHGHVEEWGPLLRVHELRVVFPVLGHVLIGAVHKDGQEEETDQLQSGGNTVG